MAKGNGNHQDSSNIEMFEILSHPTRIAILRALQVGPLGFSELKRQVGLESSGHLQFHLGRLARFITTNPAGDYVLTDDGKEALRLLSVSKTFAQGNDPSGKTYIRRHKVEVIVVTVVVLGVLSYLLAAGFFNPGGVTIDLELSRGPDVNLTVSFDNQSPVTFGEFQLYLNDTLALSVNASPIYPYSQVSYPDVPIQGIRTNGGTYQAKIVFTKNDGSSLTTSVRLGIGSGVKWFVPVP